MKLRLRRPVTAAALALAVSAPLSAQSVLLRMSTEEGLVSRYRMGMEMYMESPMMTSDQPMLTGTMYQTQTILGVEGDVIEMQTVTDSADMSMPAMPTAAGAMPDLTGQTAVMKMDSRGRIVELTDVEDLPPEAQQMMSQFGSGFGMELPEGEVGPGDSWSASLDLDLPGGGAGMSSNMTMDVTYTLVGVSGDIANIAFEGPITLAGDAGGMQMDGTGAISGTLGFDHALGRLQSSDLAISLDMNAAGMAMSIDQSITMELLP